MGQTPACAGMTEEMVERVWVHSPPVNVLTSGRSGSKNRQNGTVDATLGVRSGAPASEGDRLRDAARSSLCREKSEARKGDAPSALPRPADERKAPSP